MEPVNSKKLELAVRGNKGRVEYPYYTTELSHLLKSEVRSRDLLSLQATRTTSSLYTEPSRSGALRSIDLRSGRCGCMSQKSIG